MTRTIVGVAALGAILAGVVVVTTRLTATDRRGDLYAFDDRTGAVRWHERFSGVDPVLSVRRGVILVNATKEKRCAGGDAVLSWFDAQTGRHLGPRDRGSSLMVPGSIRIRVRSGTVTVNGLSWRAHVVDRGEPVRPEAAAAAGSLAIVAIGGKRVSPCSTE